MAELVQAGSYHHFFPEGDVEASFVPRQNATGCGGLLRLDLCGTTFQLEGMSHDAIARLGFAILDVADRAKAHAENDDASALAALGPPPF